MSAPVDAATNALFRAVLRGNVGGVARAIQRGGNVEITNSNGEPVLVLAGRLGLLNVSDLLLKAGASILATNPQRYTALHTAGLSGNVPLIRRLLKAGASVSSRNINGDTPLISAALRGHNDAVAVLLDAGSDIDASDKDDRTSLMWAATHRRSSTVAALLDAGADHTMQDNKGATALHNSTESYDLPGVQALLRAGAHPMRGSRTENVLFIAVDRCPASMGMLLRAGGDVSEANADGMTPLQKAIVQNCAVSFMAILEHLTRQDDDDALCSEHVSLVAQSAASAVQPRLRSPHGGEWSPGHHMRMALSANRQGGNTALHMAAMMCNLRFVHALLHRGAVETPKNASGITPFYHPTRISEHKSAPVVVNGVELKIKPSVARAVAHSLCRGPAFRARSWLWPTVQPSSPPLRREGTGFAALRAKRGRRRVIFVEAIHR